MPTITGSAGNATPTGAWHNDIINGLAGNDPISGGGADTLCGGAGNDALDGGSGSDFAECSGNRSAYTITNNGYGVYMIAAPRWSRYPHELRADTVCRSVF